MSRSDLPHSAPEAQGISSRAILAFVDAVDAGIHELHSFMLLRHGTVIAEGWWAPYAPQRPHMLFSLSKSFTSTAIGRLAAEGRLSLDDRVVSFFPEDAPAAPGANLAKMRVRDLLAMATGHIEDTTFHMRQESGGKWVKAFLELPVEHEPGTYWVYNTGATYMLSAIVQKVSGQMLLDYLTPRLLEPLGIEGAAWEISPEGIHTGGFGLSVKTEDIARFGQLYLQKGVWEGQRILPEAWVEEATSKRIANEVRGEIDWRQGYGYQFWRCRYNAYRGDGAFGQYCLVLPDQDAVLAITAGLDDMQAVLNLVWKHLLPAMGPGALPEDCAANASLQRRSAGLALPIPAEQASSPRAESISGKCYRMAPNPFGWESVTFEFEGEPPRMNLHTSGCDLSIPLGRGTWLESRASLSDPSVIGDRGMRLALACGTWTAEDVFTVTVRYVETPFFETFSFRFRADWVAIQGEVNASFSMKGYPLMKGNCA
jgi:CubicO group peptidase (beta-lactamase class C family)